MDTSDNATGKERSYMAKMLCRTKGNASPKGKPRVYFTCHPEDFDRYFEKICQDIFKTHDCAIYYTEDMAAVIEERDKATDLESNNLFVVPVTFRLLSTPNRGMDSDIPFALEKHIPVLPFMMESGLDEIFSCKFGQLQYLNLFTNDETEISYEEKLKKHLESVLISDEMAQLVRSAFDAYIFLSYRKKDRRYANQLMRLIHSYPQCRDIAIWYDEFLTPGEDFRDNIEKILHNSKLFTLLVTPNLLEEPEGKPNFVMGEEYPAAHRSGIPVLPAEMEETDKVLLGEKYEGLPACLKPNEEAFRTRLLELASSISTGKHNNDPMHIFLMGLAYFDGIDVETDRERGLQLITEAAEMDLPAAMVKLSGLYENGIDTLPDYRKAAYWCERLLAHHCKHSGEEAPITVTTMHALASMYDKLQEYYQAQLLTEKVYALSRKLYGDTDQRTRNALGDLAVLYAQRGNYAKAEELQKQAIKAMPTSDWTREMLTDIANLAGIYARQGHNEKALALKRQVYEQRSKLLGSDHVDTLNSLKNLSASYKDLGDCDTALTLLREAYDRTCKLRGEAHPDTLRVMAGFVSIYVKQGNYAEALVVGEKLYKLCTAFWGEDHPASWEALANLATVYGKAGEFQKSLELLQRVYSALKHHLGEEHPNTLSILNNLSYMYGEVGDYQQAIALSKRAYALRNDKFGPLHSDTLDSLANLAYFHKQLGEYDRQAELLLRLYQSRCQKDGADHPGARDVLVDLAGAYYGLRDFDRLLPLQKQLYELFLQTKGETHPDTIGMLNNLAFYYGEQGDFEEELPLQEEVYRLRLETLGAEHPDVEVSLNNLRYVWRALLDEADEATQQQNVDAALALQVAVYHSVEAIEGPDHIDAAYVLQDMTISYVIKGNHGIAVQMLAAALLIHKEQLGLENEDTQAILNQIVPLAKNAPASDDLRTVLRMTYGFQSELYGDTDDETISTMFLLALVCRDLEDYQEETFFLEKVYEHLCQAVGKDHPTVENIRKQLVTAFRNCRK